MRAFGIYFMILGMRYLGDGYEGINPLTKYKWKRKVRITLPAFLCAFVPDAALTSINRYLEDGKPEDLNTYKKDEVVRLKVIVHVGPKGFQKVGHICFAYDDIVYSYGNYDSDSFHLNQTIGDGIFFTVPLEKYIPNMITAENNSIFEYGIYTTSKQNTLIEKEIEKFVKMVIVGIQRLKKKMGMIVLVNMKWIIQVVCIIERERSYIRSRVVNSIFTGL